MSASPVSTQLSFDSGERAEALEVLYGAKSVTDRRRRALELVGLKKGDMFLDIGSGPGFLTVDAARIVTTAGRVHALDNSATMLASAKTRVQRESLEDIVSLHEGDALSMSWADCHFDCIAVIQVYEYVSDISRALSELYRVIKPGGRYAIIDTDWGSMVWRSTDAARMDKILHAWDGHLADPYLPRTLAPRLHEAGLPVDHVEANVQMCFGRADIYANTLAQLISRYVRSGDEPGDDDVDAWLADLASLDASNAYFQSVNQFIFSGTREAS